MKTYNMKDLVASKLVVKPVRMFWRLVKIPLL
ncbi:hypothetical protein RB43ORF083w [Escherichia phage RB43]|uniref:Uncharacterized protein n=1 Tax=Escherichia phage RB43 TaxID=2887182 RepID=Q56BW5_9CAUD|nr:hypothetical protein RB43ORF083w [Escherichia phage RB43]AAX78605.1 hypothetical protein RB43ORF083w [Escherichia phage RB43]